MPPEYSQSRSPSAGITDGKLTRVPNSPKTPHHSFRIPDDLYQQALKLAQENGEALTEVVRAALQAYIDRHSGDETQPPGDGQP